MTISIIICTYHPRVALLERVIERVTAQSRQPDEIVVVDNNSPRPVAELPFIALNSRVTCVREKRQGLAYARIAGLNASSGSVLVFADDDNLLDTEYLAQLETLLAEHPEVAVWGPGTIDLEFELEAPSWLRTHFGHLYQEKHQQRTEFGSVAAWPPYYPSGSGMVIRREVMQQYARNVEGGRLSITGRKGEALSSAEDSQIVWTAVKSGLSAGTAPQLRLTHVIHGHRLSMHYLRELQFNLALSYRTAFNEMFPDRRSEMAPLSLPGKIRLAFTLMRRARFSPALFYRMLSLELAWFRGIEAALLKG